MIDWLKRAAVDPEIELNGTSVPITLRRHPTAKRLTLRLAPDGSAVKITLPRWADGNEALAFAHARKDWLANQHARIPSRSAPQAGGDLMFRGQATVIDWAEEAPRRPKLEGGALRVGGAAAGLEARIRRWLEAQALTLLEGDLDDYVTAARLDPVPIGLSRAQKRWGSCSDGGASGQRRIRINWRLVQAPDFVRRSVVAHEVAHLVHFDHSPAFHALLGDIFEGDIAEADGWLKTKGRTLYTAFG
ncbi:MAG: YgjP-like metallopeptidase domain-containing protein [Pseudomonadota bacterium]